MTTTLDEARGVVQGLFGSRRGIKLPQTGGGGRRDAQGNPIPADPMPRRKGETDEEYADRIGFPFLPSEKGASTLPPGLSIDSRTGDLLADTGGVTSGDSPRIPPGGFFDMGGDVYQWNGKTYTEASEKESKAYWDSLGEPTPGGDSDAVGFGNLAQRRAEEQRRIYENERDYNRSILEGDRDFGQGQIESNRAELGNRFGGGISLGGLLLDLQGREDELAKDPGNFPAFLNALQGVSGQQPYLQELVGQGLAIQPREAQYLNDPRFKQTLDSMFNYANAPSGGDVDRTQQAFNADPTAASRFFSQDPAALERMFGKPMAQGGSFTTKGPMTFRDLTTGQPMGIAGEVGPEKVTVQPVGGTQQVGAGPPQQGATPAAGAPQGGMGAQGQPRFASAGTFGAAAKAIRAHGFGGEFPRDVLARMEQGFAPNPGDLPDWLLQRLPPSIRELITAGILSQLGGTGAGDYDYTRGLYNARGFSGAGGVVR